METGREEFEFTRCDGELVSVGLTRPADDSHDISPTNGGV